METKCKNCSFDLLGLDVNLRLKGRHHSVFCPVCGSCITETAEIPGAFYDEEEKTYVIWDLNLHHPAEVAATQKSGDFELTVEGKAIHPYDICYQRVIVFQHEGKAVLPFTGVKPEFYRYLKPFIHISGQWSPPHFLFEPVLRGNYSVQVRLNALLSQTEPGLQQNRFSNGTALNVWPNFHREGWRNYFIYFVSTDPNVKVKSLRVIGEGQEEKRFIDRVPRGEINFVPAYIEISVTDLAGVEYWSSYKVDFKDGDVVQAPSDANGNESVPLLSLDFGTSNTCFAMSLPDEDSVKVIEFHDRTKRLINGLNVEDSITFTWFPEVQDGEHPTQLPSELIFAIESERIGHEIREFQPIVNYTVPPFTRYREGEERYVLGEFKWERALISSHLKLYTFDLQYLYLTLAVRLALAELVSTPRCQRFDRIGLVATCPLAFTATQREQYREVILRVQRSIAQQTGIKLILIKMYDESHAGAAGSGQLPGTTETIYVDVGGGTTDLGLFRFDEVEGKEQERAIYLDSMQYAGDDVWRAITKGKLSDWTPIRFEREARSRSAKSIFDDQDLEPFRNQLNNLHKARRSVQKFVDGLVEFITRMIAAREATRTEEETLNGELGLYMLGNGWRFIEALIDDQLEDDPGESISTCLKNMVEARLSYYGFAAPTLSVTYPILNNITPKLSVVVGAAMLYIGEKLFQVQPEPEFTLRSFLGSDLVISSSIKQEVGWHEPVPYALETRSGVQSVNYKINAKFKFEAEQVNGTRIQAENLLKPLLTSQGGRAYIGKNIFAYYLERWHTELLLSHP